MVQFGKSEMGKTMHFIPAGLLGKQVIKTQNGSLVVVPPMLGSTTNVKPLKDGTYEVVTKGSRYGSEPITKILSEDELVSQYGLKVGGKIQVLG